VADTTNATETVEEEITEYTSETPASAGLGESTAGGRGQSLTAPGNGVGRRKQAIARVRLVPGTGEWTINGRTLEEYFPNKLHQQLVNEPFTLLDLGGRFDVIVRISGGGPSGQAGAVPTGRGSLAQPDRRGVQPRRAEEGRLPASRRSRPRAQEGRTQEGP
jgi:small subunit ribosomal protein S9